MNALSPGIPDTNRGPQRPRKAAHRFPRLPLVLGLVLIGFSISATVFGMQTGMGTVLNVYGRPEAIRAALSRLRCAPLLRGYRGRPAADMGAILAAVAAVQAYVLANAESVGEVEVNPLICTPRRAVAVDALIRKAKT